MIEVRGLTKYYGKHAAIENLAFDIQQGEVVGFLGLNGAGKSTTLKVLSCVLLPTSGSATVQGVDILQDAHKVREKIGYLPDTPPLYNEMTVGAYLAFAAELRGVAKRHSAARVAEAEEKTNLRHMHKVPISALSHGYRQRVGVAQALVHRPALLILDEPTSGLDPVQIVEMRELVRGLRGDHTVLISSHILSEISQTCDRLLVIHQGRIRARGSEQEIAQQLGTADRTAGVIEVTIGAPDASTVNRATELLQQMPGITNVEASAPEVSQAQFRLQTASDIRPDIVRELVAADLDVLRLERTASRLESLFLQLTEPAQGTPAASGSEELT